MKKVKQKEMTLDELAIMVANGFSDMEFRSNARFIVLEDKMDRLDQNLKSTRQDVLNMGDRFVTRHVFDELSSRVHLLEKKFKK